MKEVFSRKPLPPGRMVSHSIMQLAREEDDEGKEMTIYRRLMMCQELSLYDSIEPWYPPSVETAVTSPNLRMRTLSFRETKYLPEITQQVNAGIRAQTCLTPEPEFLTSKQNSILSILPTLGYFLRALTFPQSPTFQLRRLGQEWGFISPAWPQSRDRVGKDQPRRAGREARQGCKGFSEPQNASQ